MDTLNCNCAALRQAGRFVTQFYDQHLAPTGLRASQFSILAKLSRLGPMTINALAAELVMDRTTLGRNILPLERDGLVAIAPHASDRRSKQLCVTRAGEKRLGQARRHWGEAQKAFEAAYGDGRAAQLRALLGAVVASELRAP
jgi:DNA-binding MarR family transcriptional regulator